MNHGGSSKQSIGGTSRPSETELVEREARPREGESVAQSLQRSLLHLQSRRGIAYARLNRALRATMQPRANVNEYKIACANVAEDLKLVNEGIAALRQAIWVDNMKHSQSAVRWLDGLQEMEERKFVAFVSLHTVQRSRDAGIRAGDGENLEEKMGRFAKTLHELDTDINDVMDEIREFIAEEMDH